ncbi:MFS transporter [Streptococcus iniae]
MKAIFEKISLLSLSLMMISPFSVSPALPKMMAYYQALGYQAASVNILFSLSSVAILGILVINPILNRYLSEKAIVIIGLSLLAFGGSSPFLFQAYPLVFLSRILLGVGIGLINAKAINIISERFSGKARVKLLGYRASFEVVGSSILTFVSGYLIAFGWSKAFLIYALAIPILILYLVFVPQVEAPKAKVSHHHKVEKLKPSQVKLIFGLALYAGFVILVNTSITLRVPLVVDQMQLGSPKEASLILSLMMLMGIISSLSFSHFLVHLKSYFMGIVAISLDFGTLVLWSASSLLLVAIGALLTGLVYSLGVTLAFHTVSEAFPPSQLTAATTFVLIGCNIGGGAAALVLQMFSTWSPSVILPYLIYAIISLIMGSLLIAAQLFKQKKSK